MKFGNATLKHGLFLAPMAGDTDSSMRRICHAMGAELTVTEMISAKAMHHGDTKTWALARIHEGEGAVSVQIFGHEPEIMAEAARMLSDGSRRYAPSGFAPASIDVNMGCPVKKITSNGEGSALMRDKVLASEILSACVEVDGLPEVFSGHGRALDVPAGSAHAPGGFPCDLGFLFPGFPERKV